MNGVQVNQIQASRRADVQMLLATVIWGSSYLFMKSGLASMQELNLIALRFGIAFVAAGLLFHRRLRSVDRGTLLAGGVLGTALFAAFVFITYGVQRTTASQAGFLISLAVIFVPILTTVLRRRLPDKRLSVSIVVAVAGLGLLTLQHEMSLHLGDLLCIIAALVYAIYILLAGKYTPRHDPLTLGIVQLGVAALLGTVATFLFETPQLPDTPESWASILGLGVLCSGLGYILQTFAQRHASPTRTSLIFSLEPLFAATFAFIFQGESLTLQGYCGAALMLAGVLITEIKLPLHLFRRRKRPAL
ncbi:Permease of the drug/metabolite transporter (DMT) superfamily [Paenibacillus polysaccharolyticus]|uniref:Permease of the drug/metabolite transporter (DMT) superfamily n=1 Tax=Paenibacillus polysaccharolyticus TaxID=582692 RepID=A0A1G5ISZ7_9BACL|nr:DMT family transporter [Paenibacillus polysaccharolyticus]SCY78538.1 Permease of the drug/metabolite transporter (DMT) superfamily [Paenibacillus polysaccharolyticus]